MDMADLPVQLPAAPASAAASRARFFNSGNAFNVKLAPVPAAGFAAQAAAAMAQDAPTGFIACDQSAAIGCPFQATTPLVLARYAVVRAGETLALDIRAHGAVAYVLRGAGEAVMPGETIAWGQGDVMLLPNGARFVACDHAVFWLVSNEPMLAFEALSPDGARVPAVHYPAAEIERQLAIIGACGTNDGTSGLAVIFSSDGLEAWRNITPSLTLSLNTLPPGQHQRAHRHNSVAVTLALQGERCHSMVGGARHDWVIGSTMVTPPGDPHSHHNNGDVQARFLIVQDGGLHYHARTMGFEFLE